MEKKKSMSMFKLFLDLFFLCVRVCDTSDLEEKRREGGGRV